MLRNREIHFLFLVIGGIILVATGLAVFVLSYQAALLTLLTSIALVSCFVFFTRWRYREIERLSGYLRQISSGDYTLDVRNNHEGELSILKNDIYKVTMMLSEHRSLLQEDKVKLTNAISDISHQLKTPLTSMLVMVDLVSDPNLDEEKRVEFTTNIRVQLERIEWLVSSLLKLSKIDAGTITFKKESISPRQVIQKAVESILIPVDIKQQNLSISGDDSATFVGDVNWTSEALLNILKNCVEHTGEGGTISLSYSENPLYTEIIISDNGNGIPKEDLPYIFKRFYRGKNAGDDSVVIGLAMAYSIITSQNGDIEVTSEQGTGTEFTIKFYKQVV
ncbi:HAMP domain-containing histidine kinase [Alkalihalobacillus hwajinpoensis]|uniref:sensor histidine kinase n=1 Tax=Guptibacillus hwajinpoensis TaxID=208199 RepID=UPI0018834929|nr:HAMP domain-containing sensor histidine kinase [Pseudalkalibacillus hwajinpoensis]MBF0705329.1 HAMP domain-containing histidine kinase [Pseudalkalibacillus hwajinpoensis]